MKKICIANPPAYYREFPDRHFIQAGSRWSFSMDLPPNHDKDHYQPFPFNLAYLSSQLKHDKFLVYPFDACAHDMSDEEFKAYVFDIAPDVLVVEVPTVSFPPTMRLLGEIKRELDCKIGVVGAHIMARPQDAPDYVDPEIMKMFTRWKIDKLPLPDREDFPADMYHDFEFQRPTVQMLSSRGCTSGCSFCVQRHVLYKIPKYWRRKAKSVVDEMLVCRDAYGAKQIYFDDDTMTINKKHVEVICKRIIKEKVNVPWTCMGDVTIDEDTLELMAKAGCIGIKFGVESFRSRTWTSMGKYFMKGVQPIIDFVKKCRELGIWSHATYMIGLVGDSKRDIELTIECAADLNSDSCQFSIATPFPGTPFHRQCEINRWFITDDWTRFDGARNSVISYPWLSNTEIDGLFQKSMAMRIKYNLNMRKKVKRK